MSQFYDQASLVMVPSGYKDGKLYSQKPLSTSGELSFSRGSDIEATRVNANGYIHKAQVNLLLQSNSFDTTWFNILTTSTSGQSGYDGTSDAWLLDSTAGYLYQSISATGVHTISVYVKAGTAEGFRIRVDQATDANYIIDLSDGSLISQSDNIAYKSTSVGGGWYRMEMAFLANTITNIQFRITDLAGATASGTAYIQDAQLNYGLVAQTYQETTTAAVVSGITDNMPRLNYDPANPTCPSLLLEPSRTNYYPHSEYLASYAVNRGSISSNVTTSPEGVVNASELVPTTDNGDHTLQALIDLGNVTNTFSIFAKRNGVDISLTFAGSSSSWTGCIFDLANGIAKTPQNSGSQSICTASIEPYGDDWYKCSITATPYASGTFYVFVSLANNVNGSLSTWGRQSFVGVPSQTAYLYGGDLQRGSYPTSYIPCYGSSATRTADANCNILSLLSKGILSSATEWTVFFNVEGISTDYNLSDGQFFSGQNGTLDVYVREGNTAEQYARFYWRKDGKYIGSTFGKKIIARLSGGTGTTFVDGTLNGSSSISGDYSLLGFARNSNLAGVLKQMIIFPTALTDAQCIELTQ